VSNKTSAGISFLSSPQTFVIPFKSITEFCQGFPHSPRAPFFTRAGHSFANS
jgi:hypothetical protein